MHQTCAILLGTVLLGTLAGCGTDEIDAIPVSGVVKLQGQPLDQGFIEFAPLDEKHRMSGAAIKDGEYSIPAEQGLSAGNYQVRITSTVGGSQVDPNQPPGESNLGGKERIPAQFNTQTQQEVEVKEQAENKFDFNIP